MNNWRLLLLALVAVFQPITSFTERSLVDGSQQCCDRQTDTLLRDSKPYLYENNRLAKPSSSLRRLNFRDETREDRQLRQQVTLFSHRSTERSLENIRERKRQSPTITSRSTRVDYRRVVSDDSSEPQPDGLRRERNTLTRVSMQRNGKINELLSFYSQSRGESRINRLSNERQDREMQRNGRTNELLSRYSQSTDERRINRLSNEHQDRETQHTGRTNELLSRYSQSRDESRINRLSNQRQDRETQRNSRTNELLSSYSQSRDESRINRLSNERHDREMQRNGRTNELLSRYSQPRDESRINRLSNERQDREMQRNGRTNELLSRYSQSRDESRINRLSNERQDREMQRNGRTNELLSRYSQSRDESRINRLSNERQDREMQRNDRTNELLSRYSQSRDKSRINRLSNERQDREMQRNGRTNELLSRYSRDEIRINRLSNEHQDREISQTVRMEFRSETFDRMTSTRASRDSLWMKRVAEDRTRVYRESRGLLERERVNVILRESTYEHREQERHAEQRRSLSENSNVVSRVQDIKANLSAQKRENREGLAVNLQHSHAHRQSRETVKENTDIRVSDERMLSDRREIRDSRLINDRNVRDQVVENRRDTRLTERLSKETRDGQFLRESRVESRASRRIAERDSRVTDQRARSRNIQNFRDARSDSKLNRYYDTIRESDASRRHTEHRSTMANRDRDIVDNRFRNVESTRPRDDSIMIHKIETENDLIGNWQYIVYSIQAAYICGLVIQMLTPNRYEKSKMGNLRWWPLASQRLIKVD